MVLACPCPGFVIMRRQRPGPQPCHNIIDILYCRPLKSICIKKSEACNETSAQASTYMPRLPWSYHAILVIQI